MDKKEEFNKFLSEWHHQILKPWHGELAKRLNKVDHAALYSCIPDCFEIMFEIYYELIPRIIENPDDYEKLHDLLFEIGGIGGALGHIKSHIIDAEKGFLELLNLLAEKTDQKK